MQTVAALRAAVATGRRPARPARPRPVLRFRGKLPSEWDSGSGRVDAAFGHDDQIIHQPSSVSLHLFQVNSAAISNTASSGTADHGYIAVLTALATLEQSVAVGPPSPSVELVLRAERDFRVLKHRIFTCRDYASYGEGLTVLSPKPPALLAPSLLAERVVSMLEGKFLATVSTMSARSMEPDMPAQDHELSRTASFLTGSNQQAAATTRRLERSLWTDLLGHAMMRVEC